MMMDTMLKHSLDEIKQFGGQLIASLDLDPVYCAIWNAQLPQDQLRRLLWAYILFYHLGVAAQLSEFEGKDFWRVVKIAAQNAPRADGSHRWPRGAERRHFRGQKCVDAVEAMRDRYDGAEAIIERLVAPGRSNSLQLSVVMDRVQALPMMGPWAAFKAADLFERLLAVPIEFPPDLTLFYKEPRAALDMLELPAEQANQALLAYFNKFDAPPSFNRKCGVAETETICCKTKSFWYGHYTLGKDIREVRHGLRGWGDTADRLYRSCPAQVALAEAGGLFSEET
jgi:hypothetical protein